MAESIAYYLNLLDDKYRPPNSKPLLQQYDNYQIYDLYFTTVSYKSIRTYPGGNIFIDIPFTEKTGLVAVQHYSIEKPLCDFQIIAENYK